MARAIVLLLLALASGCGSAPTDETPGGTVQLFLEAMERSQRDPAALEDAYRLLSQPSRRALQERVHFAVQVGSRRMQPWEMIARSRYRQTFTPGTGSRGMRESIDGDSATVTVRTQDGQRTAQVPLVLEDERWRIVLDIPPTRQRPAAEEEVVPPSTSPLDD